MAPAQCGTEDMAGAAEDGEVAATSPSDVKDNILPAKEVQQGSQTARTLSDHKFALVATMLHPVAATVQKIEE